MKKSQTTKGRRNKTIAKYLNTPESFEILGFRITKRPLKLRWKLLAYGVSQRLRDYCKKESGLTSEEYSDPDYAGFLRCYEDSFFSIHYKPEGQPSGKDNLVEVLKACCEENVDWDNFIYDHLKGKSEKRQLEKYNAIRKAGLELYRDFFTEIYKLKSM